MLSKKIISLHNLFRLWAHKSHSTVLFFEMFTFLYISFERSVVIYDIFPKLRSFRYLSLFPSLVSSPVPNVHLLNSNKHFSGFLDISLEWRFLESSLVSVVLLPSGRESKWEENQVVRHLILRLAAIYSF